MIKIATASVAALVAGWIVAGTATSASAHGAPHRHCAPCGPLPPTVHVHIVHPNSTYTRYHYRSVYRHVPRYHRIVTVTEIQPIVHIHDVTRVHHRSVYFVRDTYANEVVRLPPLTYVHSSVVNTYDGGWGCH